MDVPVYEAEKVITIRVDGREPYPIHRCPVRSFEPIRAEGYPGNSGWVEVSACDEPTAICVAPPGSELRRVNGKLFLFAMIPRMDRTKPTAFDADWLLSFSGRGAYGLRIRVPREPLQLDGLHEPAGAVGAVPADQIGRASCRERVSSPV